MTEKLPEWDMSDIYPSPDSERFHDDIRRVREIGDEIIEHCSDPHFPLLSLIKLKDEGDALIVTLTAYTEALLETDSENKAYLKALNESEEISVFYDKADDAFIRGVSARKDEFSSPELSEYRYYLDRIAVEGSHLMSEAEEALASELARTGENAWQRLMSAVTSTAADGDKTLIELRALASDPDRTIRKDSYERELQLLDTHKTAVAAALNGVKGSVLTLERRRGWADPLDRSLFSSAISRKTLDALLGAMRESLPLFHHYFHIKARLMDLDKMDFYDLFAPVGKSSRKYSFQEAKEIVISAYKAFSTEMGAFAEMAFRHNWLDAAPHKGKAGGAFDIFFPARKQSRIFFNFDSSYDSVATIAHEMGHAYHDSVIKELPVSLSSYPMTLAETASIFGEMLVSDYILSSADRDEALTIIEAFVQNAAQVIVDILSRYIFEKSVFERRRDGEITADELSEMMLSAQSEAYGDAIGEKHKYMWAVKSHYYSADFSYYNYPYAFGELFALSLYSQKDKKDFPSLYRKVLENTGRMDAAACASIAGCNIEDKEFWKAGLDYIGRYIEELEKWL